MFLIDMKSYRFMLLCAILNPSQHAKILLPRAPCQCMITKLPSCDYYPTLKNIFLNNQATSIQLIEDQILNLGLYASWWMGWTPLSGHQI
jgi:hypothetical protein